MGKDLSRYSESAYRSSVWFWTRNFEQVISSSIRISRFSRRHSIPIWGGAVGRSVDVVHVVCPGVSALSSIRLIDSERELIFGCNLTALLPLRLNVLTIENANASAYSDIQYLCARDAVNNNGTILAIKNLWMQDRFTPEIAGRYAGIACLLREAPICPGGQLQTALLAKALLKPVFGYFLQYKSSMFLLIAIAVANGANRVVLHGVDFGGKYFWEDPRFKLRHPGLPVSNDSSDSVEEVGPKTPELLMEMKRILSMQNIHLYSATHESPTSNILPVHGVT